MKYLLITLFTCWALTVSAQQESTYPFDKLMNDWHKAAANADSNAFFGFMHPKAIYIGTEDTERWTKDQFYKFAIPYFRKGKAWDFKPIERNWNFSPDGNTAWFDELLNTWMNTCRSTGVLVKENGEWKLIHYQLSVTVENDKIKEFIKLREKAEPNGK